MTMQRLIITSPHGAGTRIAALLRERMAGHIADDMETTVAPGGDTVVLHTADPNRAASIVMFAERDAVVRWSNDNPDSRQ